MLCAEMLESKGARIRAAKLRDTDTVRELLGVDLELDAPHRGTSTFGSDLSLTRARGGCAVERVPSSECRPRPG